MDNGSYIVNCDDDVIFNSDDALNKECQDIMMLEIPVIFSRPSVVEKIIKYF